MKFLKRFTIWAACLCLLLSMAACSGGGGKETTAAGESAGQTETGTVPGPEQSSGTDETTAAAGSGGSLALTPVEKEPYDPLKYVDLGEYKGLEVSKAQIDVDDATLEMVLASELSQQAYQQEVTDRPAKSGDMVNIDYIGTVLCSYIIDVVHIP